jgi:hypothetical protein
MSSAEDIQGIAESPCFLVCLDLEYIDEKCKELREKSASKVLDGTTSSVLSWEFFG